MNWYLVQYADNNGMVYQWTQADTHLDAAADVLIDRGFDPMLHKQDDTLITVVRKHDYVAGSYPKRDVKVHADRALGLTPTPTLPDDPTNEADWWKHGDTWIE